MPIRLAIVDGHTLTRYGLRQLIAGHPDIELVAECESAAGAPRVLAAVRPDVVTVDVALPDGDGMQLAREFRDRYADLGIVILTSQGQDDVLFRALETGVSAFVAKTAPLEEVLVAIRHAAVAASSFTASGLAVALSRRRDVQERLALSPREAEVLSRLRDGLSIPAIAQEMFISQSTAKTYVARLYEKLGAANRAQALMTAGHYGLIPSGQDGASCHAPARAHRAGQRGPQSGARPAAADRSRAEDGPAKVAAELRPTTAADAPRSWAPPVRLTAPLRSGPASANLRAALNQRAGQPRRPGHPAETTC
jgi:DNA-binding NarL/FixJ family response regulator